MKNEVKVYTVKDLDKAADEKTLVQLPFLFLNNSQEVYLVDGNFSYLTASDKLVVE